MPDAPVIVPVAPVVVPATEPVVVPPVMPPVVPPVAPPAEDPAATITRLEAEVKSARAEAGKDRINAKATAAEDARKELAQQVGKALGLVPEDVTDPAKLAEQVSASQAQAKQSAVELAVFRAADAANGDPIALLDSRAFLAKAADINPHDTTALVAAITEAVAENPRLGTTAPAIPGAGMRPNPAQGSSASAPLGLDAQIAAAEKAGDFRTSMRLKAAKSISTT